MENNNPIYQWLSTVEDQGQSMLSQKLRSLRANRALAENEEQVKDTALATGIPRIRIPLEISDDLRANGHSASRKRDSRHLKETKASSTHETILGSEGHKRSRNCYELRPRYKTREDHYEYKGPSSAVETQSQYRKGRAKKPRGRRHTMNDDFRAINVTGNRLTVSRIPRVLDECYLRQIAAQQYEPGYIQQGTVFFCGQSARKHPNRTSKTCISHQVSEVFRRIRSCLF
jgi:hypothetical protein